MYLIPLSFRVLTRSGEILLVLELGEHLPPILQILAHYL